LLSNIKDQPIALFITNKIRSKKYIFLAPGSIKFRKAKKSDKLGT